jgi:GWxTD domain-containing protein
MPVFDNDRAPVFTWSKDILAGDGSPGEETAMKKLLLVWLVPAALLALSSCGVITMPSHDEWYTQHYYIMQDFERQTYKALSPAARLEFQQVFWEARDSKSKKVFDERMNFVMKTYKRDNYNQPWNCDRARIYLLNGPPNDVEVKQNTSWAMGVKEGGAGVVSSGDRTNEDISADTSEIWVYRWDIYLVNYIFTFRPPNEWRYSSGTGRYLGELETWSKENTYGIRNPADYNLRLDQLKSLQ